MRPMAGASPGVEGTLAEVPSSVVANPAEGPAMMESDTGAQERTSNTAAR